MDDETSHEPALPKNKGGRPKVDSIILTKAARARFDTLAAENIEAVFQAVLTAATQDGDMAAAKLLIDRVIPSRRGAPVSFHIRPLKAPEDCASAYADLLDDVGAGRLTPEEAQTISAIVAKRAELVFLGRAGGRDGSRLVNDEQRLLGSGDVKHQGNHNEYWREEDEQSACRLGRGVLGRVGDGSPCAGATRLGR